MTAIIDDNHDILSCPHCDGKLRAPKRIVTANLESADTSELTKKIDALASKLEAPPTKIEKEIEYPSFMPGEYCASGDCSLGGVHPNKNYKTKGKACKNCSQIAPKRARRCAWCNQEDFQELDDDYLKELGIKLPSISEDHDHHHDHE